MPGWRTVAASVRGTHHRHKGLPCQDVSGVRVTPRGVVACCADGVGSAQHAHIGARVVVRLMMRAFLPALEDIASAPQLLEPALTAFHTKIQRLATQRKAPMAAFQTTLCLMVITPEGLFSAQVGDGSVIIQPHAQGPFQRILAPQKGAFHNETLALPYDDAGGKAVTCSLTQPPYAFVLSTDGIDAVAFDYASTTPHGGFFQPLVDHVAHGGSQHHLDQDVRKFLSSARLRSKTTDDTTLVIGVGKVSD